jgi:hypothetical protein
MSRRMAGIYLDYLMEKTNAELLLCALLPNHEVHCISRLDNS